MSVKKEMSRTFRRSLLVGIPFATVVGLTALAYAVPNIFASGNQLSASLMNQNFAALETEVSGGTGGVTNLQAQVTALTTTVTNLQTTVTNLQNQVNGLQTPLNYETGYYASGFSYAGGWQYVDGVWFTAPANASCYITSNCNIPGGGVVDGTELELCFGTDGEGSSSCASGGGGAYGGLGWTMDFPPSNGNYSSTTTTWIYDVTAGVDYDFSSGIYNFQGTGQINCNMSVVCI